MKDDEIAKAKADIEATASWAGFALASADGLWKVRKASAQGIRRQSRSCLLEFTHFLSVKVLLTPMNKG